MDIFEILTDYGIEAEAAKKAEKAINKAIPLEFVAKDQYNKKVSELDETKTALKNAEGGNADIDAYKTKSETLAGELAALKTEFATYKADVEMKATTTAKKTALREALKAAGANPDDLILEALENKVDLAALEMDGDKLKDAEGVVKPLQEAHGNYFGTIETRGAEVANPPANNGGTPNPWKKGDNYSLEEQTKLYREDPAKARQLAAAAGVKL